MEPKLEKAGAGLPLIEGLVLRYWVMPRLSKSMSWDDCSQLFNSECQKILKRIEGLSEAELGRKVLVDRVPALEDSSRYWSIAMTLEHIGIVSRGMRLVIESLGKEKSFETIVDVAAVKPLGEESPTASLAQFKNLAETFVKELDAVVVNRDSASKHYHPWFGRINSRQWHWLVCSHVSIHKKQIYQIVDRIRGTAKAS